MKLNQILFRLEKKLGKFAVPNLMQIIVIGMAVVYICDMVIAPAKGVTLSSYIYFDRSLILKGQIWRLLSFTIMPDIGSPIFFIFALYFYWFIGNTLERYWGTFKFNAYYFLGVLGAVAAGFITGITMNTYLNLSLFIAFAMLAPNHEVLLFFFIPVKMKYLAMFDGLILLLTFIVNGLTIKIVLLLSVINLLVFFGGDFINIVKRFINSKKNNHKFNKARKEYNRNRK